MFSASLRLCGAGAAGGGRHLAAKFCYNGADARAPRRATHPHPCQEAAVVKLEHLLHQLEVHGPAAPEYAVPPRWAGGYSGPREEWRGLVRVDPYAFYAQAIRAILDQANPRTNYARSLAAIRGELDPTWLHQATVYGAFIRVATAYDHDLDGQIAPASAGGRYTETGTFLKLLAYLPQIKTFGVDTLYLLPVTKYSNVFRKGEVGSPYS